ncbi:MAG: hypothetical protein A2Y84_00925 [Candidatus Colwellbacteria bacterium RBG_13_48_8]|uniref:Uncharacterized protein n=1 Tax=Candidatus Colwellbacteria bacterium RBG_13_48_8 TaxID=1797685 RepID=A0A1G1YY50_9BACT|nr:MAG: hypothetical protein A2Y84_00925 [Candidatus Colwellbacteria bacterium RBG_13_48_8]
MLRDGALVLLFGSSIALLIISSLLASLGLPLASGELILRFDKFRDEVVWTGGVGTYYGIWGILAVIILINAFLCHQVYDKVKILAYVIGVGTLTVTVLFLIATGHITALN